MPVESKTPPDSYRVEHSGEQADVILTENSEPFDRDGETFYRYDEYRITVPDRPNLEESVRDGVSEWLAYAKSTILS